MDAGRLSWTGATMKRLICEAYRVQYAQVLGAPGWADTERYEIEAKAAAPSTRDQLRQMLQSLLSDRFKLALHKQSKTLPVYVLTAVKGAAKLKAIPEGEQNQPDDRPPALNQFRRRASMAQFASILSDMMSGPIFNGYSGRLEPRSESEVMVIDQTGLTGVYDFNLPLGTPGEGDLASNIEAAVSALGLRLQMKRMPVETLVVTHVERVPAAN